MGTPASQRRDRRAGWLRIRAAQHTITRNPKDSKKHSNQNLNPALSIFIKSLQHLFRLPRPTKQAPENVEVFGGFSIRVSKKCRNCLGWRSIRAKTLARQGTCSLQQCLIAGRNLTRTQHTLEYGVHISTGTGLTKG